MKAGNTFIPARLDTHLWVVLSDPSADPENVVIVNLTTHTVDEEQHCVIEKGEHPFVRHKTAVRYRDARVVTLARLRHLKEQALVQMRTSLTAKLLKRIRDGASLSEFLPEGCREILDDQGLI